MAATLAELIDEVKSSLAGYTLRQERMTYLNSASLTTSATTLQVGTGQNLAKGIIEVDDELMYVNSFDKSNNILTIMPGYGRGYGKSTAATHTQYAPITFAPNYPRVEIKQAINDTINSVYPRLYSVSSTTFTYNPAVNTYALPSDAQDVLSVTWQTVGPTKEWMPVKRWRPDFMANSTAFAGTTKTITIYDLITPGRTVQVWYKSIPDNLVNNADDFATTTGLPETCRDVITLGASYKLLSYVDAGRINLTSAESDLADTKTPSTAGNAASKYIFALYQQRLNEEATRLLGQYPIKPHYTR